MPEGDRVSIEFACTEAQAVWLAEGHRSRSAAPTTSGGSLLRARRAHSICVPNFITPKKEGRAGSSALANRCDDRIIRSADQRIPSEGDRGERREQVLGLLVPCRWRWR